MRVMAHPFPRVWEGVLRSRVAYFNALNEEQQERFRQLVKIFLDETRIRHTQAVSFYPANRGMPDRNT